MKCFRDHNLFGATRHTDAHHRRFSGGATAVVEAGIGDVHARELADQRLILEHRLQVALTDLWLIRRVRGIEFAS